MSSSWASSWVISASLIGDVVTAGVVTAGGVAAGVASLPAPHPAKAAEPTARTIRRRRLPSNVVPDR